MKKNQIEKILNDLKITPSPTMFLKLPSRAVFITIGGGNHFYDPRSEKVCFDYENGLIKIKEYRNLASGSEVALTENRADTYLSVAELTGISFFEN